MSGGSALSCFWNGICKRWKNFSNKMSRRELLMGEHKKLCIFLTSS